MKIKLILTSLLMVLLVGCGGGGGASYVYVTAPNGLSFSIVDPDISYLDTVYPDETHLYAIHVSPGYYYDVYLDTSSGDSDLYLYYDYTLSGQSLLGYSDAYGTETDSVSFYSDFSGTVYIEVYGVIDSRYLISVTESIY